MIRRHEQGEHMQPIETIQAAVSPTIQAGSHITWTRGDGSVQSGVVDLIHVDDIGIRWAFVTLPGESWSAVNLKFLTGPR